MKKLMCLCFAIFWIFISLILFLNYSIESFDNIFIDKTHITIRKDSNITNTEFISSIEKIMKSINEDIMYQTVSFDTSSKNYLLYKTQNKDNFLNINVGNNTTIISNNKIISNKNVFSDDIIKLNIPNLIYDITISDFKNIAIYNLNNASYYISSKSEDIILKTLSQNGYDVSIINEIYSSSAFSVSRLCLLPLFILCISIIIYTLSKPKEAIIKKIDGFSTFNIIILNILYILKIFSLIFLIIEVLNFLIVSLIYNGIFISYFLYSISYILINLVIILTILILSNCMIFFQRNHNQLKGKSSKKELFAATFTGKLVFSVFLIYTISLIGSNIYSIYTLYVSENNIINKIENYVTFPIYQIDNSTNSEYYEESLEKFYNNTINTNNGVLIDSNNYRIMSDNKSIAEKFNQNFIIINENYLNLNPIHKPNGDIINNLDFDYSKFNILVPEKLYSNNEIITQMKNYGYENIEFNFIYYKSDETILTFNTDTGTDNFGRIRSPLIWIFDNKYIDKIYYSEFFSNGYYFAEVNSDNAYNQFLPLIKDCKLDSIILETPFIKSDFSNSIAMYYGILIINVIPGIIYFIGLIILIIFICKLFCEMHNENIAHKKLNGFPFYSIYKNYLFLWGFTSLIIFIMSLIAHYIMNINITIIFISISIIILELIIFNIVSKKYTRKIIFQILKGE